MTREDVYIAQLKELGVWNEAFLPMVKDLAKVERRRTRVEKEWTATVPKGGKPSFIHPLYQVCVQLDRTVMEYREALGLTPKALRRLRGVTAEPAGPTNGELIADKLDRLLESEDYGAWSYEDMVGAVSKMDTYPESSTGFAGASFRQGGREETETTDDAAD